MCYLISVIVPVYNVDSFLNKCVDSILMQTYTNLEIILVDDGSHDNCSVICDSYAQKDSRVRVIHQKNRGISAARNSGMDIATGDYISFVDSDDYLSPFFYEYLMDAIKKNPEVGVVGCQYYRDEDGVIKPYTRYKVDEPTIYSYNHFCEDTLLGNLSVVVWNKLYNASLLQEIRFREGRIFEDSLFMYDFSSIVKRYKANMLIIPDFLYYYRIRKGSIIQGDETVLIDIERIKTLTDIMVDCKLKNPVFFTRIKERIQRSCLFLYEKILNDMELKRNYLSVIIPFVDKICIKDILCLHNVSLKTKIKFLIVKCTPSFYTVLRKV